MTSPVTRWLLTEEKRLHGLFCDNMAFLVLSVAICLFGTTYDICDTQENERRLDDDTKLMKLFHKDVN